MEHRLHSNTSFNLMHVSGNKAKCNESKGMESDPLQIIEWITTCMQICSKINKTVLC